MSTRRSISNSFNVVTVDDPVSVQAQYAPNDNPTQSQIHDTFQDGDLYMRTRSTDSSWSGWQKIVGENGGETDYTFGISQYKTTASASTAPSDISTWSDAPIAVTSQKPYLWAKVQKKSWNESTQQYVVDSTRYIRLTGEDGSSVMAQYAPNDDPTSSQIHDTWQEGDLYMRTKSTSDSSWSSWHKIVGENGNETDYSFNISSSKTSASSTTAPSNCYYQTWQDAPVAVTDSYPYLWMKMVKKVWNETTQQYDSGVPTYTRLTGEDGVFYEIETSVNSVTVAADQTTAQLTANCYFYKRVGGGTHSLISSYYAVYARTGSTYTLFENLHGQASSVSISDKQVQSSYDAIVIYMFTTAYSQNNPEATIYLAKKEILVKKNGNTGSAAVQYYIKTDIDNVVVPSDQQSIDLSSTPKAYFKKITGSTEAAQTMYYATYWRSGSSFTSRNSGQASEINLATTYNSIYDSLVIFAKVGSTPTTTDFDCKKEIIVQKRGNTGGRGKDARYIHLKGTGNNNPQSALCEVYNGTSLDSRTITSRGLTLIKINRSTLAITSVDTYDVFGDSVAAGETACQQLYQALNNVTSDYFACIVSHDAVRWTSDLITMLTTFGSLGLNDTTAYRVPFAFIGQKGLAQGQAMQAQSGQGSTDPPAEIVVYVSNGVMATSKEPTVGKLGGRFYYNAGEFTYSSSISFNVTPNEAPYFLYDNDYWVFEPDVSSGTATYTTAQMGYPSSNNSNWHLMFYNKQKFLMSDVMFAQYAHLGSFIFNGDWMISTNGKIDGTAYNNNANIGGNIYCVGTTAQFSVKGYTLFDNTNPLGETQVISERGTGSAITLAYNETMHTIYYGYFKKDKTYKFTCTGKRNNSSYPVYVRIRRSSNDEVSAPTMYPSTSDYTSDWGTFRVVADGYYYIEMYQDSTGSGHGGETSNWKLTEISFRPNLALDGMTGKTYQMEAYVNGTIISEHEYMGNKIVVDAEHGGFKMIGPVTVNDDDGTPNGDSRQTLFEVEYFTNWDDLTRLATLYIRDGHNILESEVDPEYGFRTRKRVSSGSTQDEKMASLSVGGVVLYDSEYWESASVNGVADLAISIYGISFTLNNTTYHKSWAELLG